MEGFDGSIYTLEGECFMAGNSDRRLLASGKAVASELDRRAVGSTAQCQNRAQVPTTLINQKVYNKS